MDFQYGHLAAWGGMLLAGGLVYLFGLVVYRIFFHPLAKYPGPLLAKITDAYMLYHAWKGDRHLEFWRLHETYGPTVRFGPNSVSFNSNSALKEIYGFKANVGKSEFYDAFAHPAHNTHNTRDKHEHARKRRVLSHAFSDSAVKEAEKYILANVRTFCDVLGAGGHTANAASAGYPQASEKWSSPVNMSDQCNYLAMDILGDLCFGKAFHMLEAPDNRYAVDLVGMAAHRHLICGTMRAVEKTGLEKILFRKIAAGRARYMQYSRGQLADRMALGDDTDRRDFFYYLLKAIDPVTQKGFTKPELWGESNLLIIAGSDTTSTGMAATFFYLVRHPEALAKATKEVRETFSSVEEITHGPALTGCTYLRACIDEAMRLSPAVGGLLPRQVLTGGMEVNGEPIPEGMVVGTPHYAIHHNSAYYPQPWSYIPERWIAGSTMPGHTKPTIVSEDDVSLAQSAFCPFSIGPRGCIGKGLAYTEMMTTLARTLFLYDVRRAVGVMDPAEGVVGAEWGRDRPGELQMVDTFTSTKKGVLLEFKPRV
ncbi:hypothetical protein SEUCBS140593_003143 [Sporothrix eucalyptigena]|uniref:Cytochrome P450 family protein n=1 Tax=Sporothrix eucalyptigena TaxID=1812306 RepID=A0ABP0BDA5_9PEZI